MLFPPAVPLVRLTKPLLPFAPALVKTFRRRFYLMRVMYGGNSEASDQHLTGYDFDILGSFLSATGFCDIRRVKKFGIFKDSSDLWWDFQSGKAVSQEEVGEVGGGVQISLNVMARKC